MTNSSQMESHGWPLELRTRVCPVNRDRCGTLNFTVQIQSLESRLCFGTYWLSDHFRRTSGARLIWKLWSVMHA
jgi:hypothetical protein